MAAHCAREGARGRGRVYLFRRSCVTALELDRVIKEMNSEYVAHHPPPLFDRLICSDLLRSLIYIISSFTILLIAID